MMTFSYHKPLSASSVTIGTRLMTITPVPDRQSSPHHTCKSVAEFFKDGILIVNEIWTISVIVFNTALIHT